MTHFGCAHGISVFSAAEKVVQTLLRAREVRARVSFQIPLPYDSSSASCKKKTRARALSNCATHSPRSTIPVNNSNFEGSLASPPRNSQSKLVSMNCGILLYSLLLLSSFFFFFFRRNLVIRVELLISIRISHSRTSLSYVKSFTVTNNDRNLKGLW